MKKYVIITVVAIMTILGIAGIDFYTDRPSFCSNCHQVRPYYRAWRRSPHSNVECNRCHEQSGLTGAVLNKASALRNLSLQNSYYGRFRPTKTDPLGNDVCLDCHGTVAEPLIMKSGTRMSHRAPIRNKIPCQSCHPGVAHKVGKQRTGSLKDSCLGCHDGQVAPSECSVCHTVDIAGKQSPDDYDLVPLDENVCAGCHVKPDCAECHTRGPQGEVEELEPNE